MGREDQVVRGAKGGGPLVEGVAEVGSVRGGLVREDVDGGASELARLESVDEGRNVDDLAASVVEEVGSILHEVDLGFGDHVGGLGELGDVEGEEVDGAEKLVEGVDLLGGSEGHDGDNIIVEYGHSHRLGENGELGSNVAVSDDL